MIKSVFLIWGEALKFDIGFYSLDAAKQHVHDYVRQELAWEKDDRDRWVSCPTKCGDKVTITEIPLFSESQIKKRTDEHKGNYEEWH